jgi:hypothetical protein
MDTFLFKPLVFNQKYLIPIHYDIVFYFSGNKREEVEDRRGDSKSDKRS